MKRVTRARELTPEEAEKYDDLREKVETERPEITARVRSQLARQRRARARQSGSPSLGERIRAAREASGLSQVRLATSARISQGYLSQLEQDEREPTLSIAARLATALGVSLDELATGLT